MSNVSGTGGNLTYPVRPYLFNTLDASDLGMFTDSVTSKKTLILKKYGIQIPYVSGAVTTAVVQPLPGEYKSVRLVVNPACPCEDCNYNFGITIEKKVKKPGVKNSDYYPTGRFYGGNIPRIGTCSNGIMAAADIATIENTILDEITTDTGGNMENSQPGIVNAKKYYIVNDTANTDASGFTVTWADGTTTVFVTAATFAAGQLGVQFNAKTTAAYGGAAFNALLVAYRIGADQFIITSIDPGLKFSIGTLVDATVAETGLLITSKSKDIQFNLRAEPGVFQIKNGISIVKITPTVWTAGTVVMRVDGATAVTANIAADQNTTIGNINTALAAKGYALPNGTGSALIAMVPTYGKLLVTSVTGVQNYNWSSKASWPFFTPDDVYVEFSQLRHLGGHLSQVHDVKPLKDQEYVKYNISYLQSGHGDMHVASGAGDYKQGYTFYILKSVWDDTTAKWDATNRMWQSGDAGFTADISLATLLGNTSGNWANV